MEPRKPGTVAVTVLAYVITTFAVQGTSHFAINADYYAAIPIMRAEPVVAMGIGSMVIQGVIFALLFPTFNRGANTVRNGVIFAWILGGFLASYIALGEAGKYAIPSIPKWFVVEAAVAFVQFSAFGALLGLIHRQKGVATVSS